MDNLSESQVRLLSKNLDRNLCTCYDVPKRTVIEAIEKGAHSLEAVSQKTYACQGSGCCEKQIERLLECLVPNDDKT